MFDALPVPTADTPLQDIVKLRANGFVKEQVESLRSWQVGLLSDLSALAADPVQWDLRLEKAELDLRKAIADYKRQMGAVIVHVRNARLTTLFSVLRDPLGALGRLFTEHRDDFALVGQNERCWKALAQEPFAYAGLICTVDKPGQRADR